MVRNIAVDLLLTIFTLGLFNLWVQHKQIVALNKIVGFPKYSFIAWLLFTIVTFGFYHIYHEYRKTKDAIVRQVPSETNAPLITILLCVFGFAFVADAIMQSHINQFFGSSAI